MKRLDRYIFWTFIKTYLFATMLLMMVAVVIDLSGRTSRLLDHNLTIIDALVQYYIHFVFYYGIFFMPLAIFISAIFFTSKLADRVEFVAMQAGGISPLRILKPYFMAATLLFVVTLVCNHFLLPTSNESRNSFYISYFSSAGDVQRLKNNNENIRINDSTYVFLGTYNTDTNKGYNFILEAYDSTQLDYKISSSAIQYDAKEKMYKLKYYRQKIWNSDEGKYEIFSGNELDTLMNFVPNQILVKSHYAQSYNTLELDDFISREKSKGNPYINDFLLEKHVRTSLPFSTFILVIIAFAVASVKRRGGTGVNLAIGLVIGFFYIFSLFLFQAFGSSGKISPGLAVWMPNLLFGVIAIILIQRAKQ